MFSNRKLLRNVLPILICMAIAGCDPNNERIEKKKGKDGDLYMVEQENKRMTKAIDSANRTIARFDRALKSGNPGFRDFSLKVRFNMPDGGGEHMWLNRITWSTGNYYGVVDSYPEYTEEVKQGDTLLISKERISDWMYVDDDTLRGGFTLRVIRDEMTAEEKKQLDASLDYIIAD